MSEFTLQDQVDALKYVAEGCGFRFVEIAMHQKSSSINGILLLNDPSYEFAYLPLDALVSIPLTPPDDREMYIRDRLYRVILDGELDDCIRREIERFQSGK